MGWTFHLKKENTNDHNEHQIRWRQRSSPIRRHAHTPWSTRKQVRTDDRVIHFQRISGPPTIRPDRWSPAARPIRNARLPSALGRTHAAHLARDVGLHAPRSG